MKFYFTLLELHLYHSLLHPSRGESLLCPPKEALSFTLSPSNLPASSLFANTLHEEAVSVKINCAEIWETESMPALHFVIGNFHLQTVVYMCSPPSLSLCAVFCVNSSSLCLLPSLLYGLLSLSHSHAYIKISVEKASDLIAYLLNSNTRLLSVMYLSLFSHIFHYYKILLLAAGFHCHFTTAKATKTKPVFPLLTPTCHYLGSDGHLDTAFQNLQHCLSVMV